MNNTFHLQYEHSGTFANSNRKYEELSARGFSDLYQVFARKQCILCPALRHGCLTLLYVTSIRDFSASGTIAHGSIRLPPRTSRLREAARWQ